MLEQPDRPERPEPDAAPKKRRTWPLRGAARGSLKVGRKPRVLTPGGTMSNAEIVGRLAAALNCSADEAASFFAVSQPTWNSRLRRYPALKAAWDSGRATAAVSLRRLLFDKATKPTGAGCRAALFLARMLIWPQDGDDGLIEKPPPPTAGGVSRPEGGLLPEALARLEPAEQERLAAIMKKLTGAE